MSYDRDIFWGRMCGWCLVAGNLGASTLNLLAHNWVVAFACLIWLYNSAALLWGMKVQQATRDQGRVIEAGLNAMRREIETGEY